jgi:hypothetical protein
MGIVAANRAYEAWLKEQLGGDVVARDLRLKRSKMSADAFSFLRATYWLWAESILDACPDLAPLPAVLAIGDTHLENFGTWTDREGRIVWGVNDYDECASMPYLLDLVRLAVSAALAGVPRHMSLKSVCTTLLDGYREGLTKPLAFVLDRSHLWLRTRFVVDERQRAAFWKKIEHERDAAAKRARKQPPQANLALFAKALPEPGIALAYWPHTAGTGSLGRPRWLGYGVWRSAPVLRETKALVPSGWVRAQGGSARPRLNEIAHGRFRAPDPWYTADGLLLVRRLSPNSRKIDVESRRDIAVLLQPELLRAMGRDLAAVHLGTGDHGDALRADLDRRKLRWFRAQVAAAMEMVHGQYEEWCKSAK